MLLQFSYKIPTAVDEAIKKLHIGVMALTVRDKRGLLEDTAFRIQAASLDHQSKFVFVLNRTLGKFKFKLLKSILKLDGFLIASGGGEAAKVAKPFC